MNTKQFLASCLATPIGVYAAIRILVNTMIFPETTFDWFLWGISGIMSGTIAFAVSYIFITYPLIWIIDKVLTSTDTFKDL